MSKQRPSSNLARTSPTDGWLRRVFRNSFTRNGRRIEVKGWSVKIQHQGVRRTISLSATTRKGAAIEARSLHLAIVTKGWDATLCGQRPSQLRADPVSVLAVPLELPKSDASYWLPRLLLRKPSPTGGKIVQSEMSVRIEHAGTSAYFPLGTSSTHAAAERALLIYQSIVSDGWDGACARFPRELNIAIHWTGNPIGWTYATFRTRPFTEPKSSSSQAGCDQPLRRVILVEGDPGIRRALMACLAEHDGFTCNVAFASMDEANREIPRCSPHLILASQQLAGPLEGGINSSPRNPTAGAPMLLYSVHEDSEHLFKATPGGASGYLLKRTPPGRFLEPIADLPGDTPLSSDQIARCVRRYFQRLIGSLPAQDAASAELARLTPREQEILGLMSKGHVDKEIADALRISAWTVHGHVKNIFEKLGVHSRTEAVVKFLHK